MKVSDGTMIAVGAAGACLLGAVCAVMVRNVGGPEWLEIGCWFMCVLSLGVGFVAGIGG